MGRWLNRDPIGEIIRDEDGDTDNIELNLLYCFVGNDAVDG
jgi:hypothetical protein